MNGLEQNYRGDLYVDHIDIDNPANAAMVELFGVQSIPFIVVLDDRSEVVTTFRGLTGEARLENAVDQGLRASASNS